MRSGLAILSAAAILGAGSAYAEKRMFIVGSSPGSYGIDRCLSSGAACGKVAATAYCRSRSFARASSFRRVDRGEITGGVSAKAPKGCVGATCADFVAIECIR